MKEKIQDYLKKPGLVLSIILLSLCITIVNSNIGYFFDLTVTLFFLWVASFRWLEFGIGKFKWLKTLLKAALYSVIIIIAVLFIIQPVLERIFGQSDLTTLDDIRGNFGNYIIIILAMWVFAAFGEELIYRGFLMKRLAIVFGNSNRMWLISAFTISLLFGIGHYYQGASGVFTVFIISIFYSIIFFKNRTNLMLVIFTHGFYDMIALTLIYLDLDIVINEWIKQL
nr:CPBP family intramembrane glutamic endopeptidase [uncultured Psychroserpens sp.]